MEIYHNWPSELMYQNPWLLWLNKHPKPFDLQLVVFILRGRIDWNLSHSIWVRWGQGKYLPGKYTKGCCMIKSSNRNIWRIIGHLCMEFTGDWWIPLTKASDKELWCILWSVPEQTVGQTIERPVIWDAIMLIMTSLQWAVMRCMIN